METERFSWVQTIPNGSAADSVLNDSLGPTQAGLLTGRKDCYHMNRNLNSAFLRDLRRQGPVCREGYSFPYLPLVVNHLRQRASSF